MNTGLEISDNVKWDKMKDSLTLDISYTNHAAN